MYGAILGDIIGSSHEWRRIKTEDFELFTKFNKVTDDTVLTIATADAILHEKSFESAYHEWGNRYPNAGYGGKFDHWLDSEEMKPYGSFGNGSAMRVSPIGWAYDSLTEVLLHAEQSAAVTHNHPEGIKGAKAVAGAIYIARSGGTKDDIRQFINESIGYDLTRTVSEIRPRYRFDSTCQGSVPESIICFLESTSYEDAVRKAVSLGGDSDTQACIAGSIAEALYGIPGEMIAQVRMYAPGPIIKIASEFTTKYHK